MLSSRPRSLRILRNTWLVLAFCILLPGPGKTLPVYAQSSQEVSLTARLGFDGYCKEKSWVPVHVEIENTGPDLEATVRVAYTNDKGGNTSTGTDLLLPTKSRKEFFLYIYPRGFIKDMKVSVSAGGHTLKEVKLTATYLADKSMLFGVLADDPSTYDILNDVKPLSGFVRIAQLAISDLPASPQAWASLDALIVSNIDTGKLSPEQKQALELWLGTGGKLFVTGGPKWQAAAAGLKDFLPVAVETTQSVDDLPALQAYIRTSTSPQGETILATGQLLRGADVIVRQDGIPILVQKQVGAGKVYYFAADPALQPLRGWPGMPALYDHILGFKAVSLAWAKEESFDQYQAGQALATIPGLGLPSIFYICGLLVLYILIIGPANYLVLRRIKRRELAWITIPALVVLFTGLAYSSGLLYRGTAPILNRLAVMQAWDGVDQAHVRSLAGIYSPTRAKYDLEATGSFMMAPTGIGDGNLQPNNDWTALLQGSTMVMHDVRVEIGGMKAVAFEGALPALDISHDLVITVDKTKPVLSGNIYNKSGYTLEGAFLVTPGQWTRLGNIAPGGSKAVKLPLTNGPNGTPFYNFGIGDIVSMSYTGSETDEEVARRGALFQAVTSSGYGLNQGNWGVYLMGWIDSELLPITLQKRRFKTVDTTLYIDMLSPSVKLGQGELILPASLFAWESSVPEASPYYVAGISNGSYTLRFRPAFPIHVRKVQSLVLTLQSNASPGELLASAWDYETKAWAQIQLTGESTNIPEADRFVGPDNEVQIKIVSNRSDWTQMNASYITLVVQP